MNLKSRSDYFALAAVLFAALLSGIASLSYEVVWSRMLVVFLGNSADAVAMVLSSFMLGIALGAVLLGRAADKTAAPLRLYAVLEVVLGVSAFAVPFLIHRLSGVESLRGSFDESPGTAVARLGVAGLIVLIPSLVMGATLPVLVRALSRAPSDIRRRIGPIYGLNTIGAAVGAAVTGFAAIPALGFTLTSAAAAVCNFAAALIVFTVRRLTDAESAPVTTSSDTPDETALPPKRIAAAALVAAGVAGGAMLASEVLWSRILTFVFGHDTYAFAALLAIVLLGLGFGGVLYRRLAHLDPAAVCTVLLGLLGAAILASYWGAASIVTTLGRDPFGLGEVTALAASLRLEFYREVLYTPILVFLPAVISGTLFPAACALYAGPLDRAGSRVGTATLVNGVGSAIGSLLTSFALVALLGIQGALVAAAMATVLASLFGAAVLFSADRRKKLLFVTVPALVAVLLAVLLPSALSRGMLEEAVGKRHQNLLFYEEGRTGTVSVTRNTINSEKQLFMNAVNEVTTRLVHDQSFKLLGHLGPLLHPDPQKGAMVCLGAGLSAGAALVHPLASLDVVELSSTIPKAAALWAEENNGVLDDKRFHLHIADGRHFLLSTEKRFDVIMVDSTHPKAVDSWILYTQEFYKLVSSRLKDDGIAVQWLPLHGLSEREFKIIVRTFYSVFPHTTLWVNVGFEQYGQAAYLKLVAAKHPLNIDYKELALRLKEPQIARDLAPFGMDSPEELLDAYLAGPRAVDAWTAKLPVQTDDRPMVPYTTEYSAGRRMTAPLLLGVRSSVMLALENMGDKEPEIRERMKRAEEAQGFLLAGLLDRAAEAWPDGKKIALFKAEMEKGRTYYLALAEKYGDDPTKLFEIGSLLGNLGYASDAANLYRKVHKAEPENAEVSINLALALMDTGEMETASSLLRAVVDRDPDHGLAQYNLGVLLNRTGNPKAALPHLEAAAALLPASYGVRLAQADALFEIGRLDKAEGVLLRLVDENSFLAEAWDMLGLVAGRRKDWESAKSYHLRALSLEPYRADSHYNLGIALEELGRIKEAAGAYLAAVRIRPDDADAWNNLGLVYARAGLFEPAADAHRKALDIEPQFPEAAYNLGLAYVAEGRTLQAAEAFGIALALNPALKPARDQLDALNLDVAIETDTAGDTDADAASTADTDTVVDSDTAADTAARQPGK